MKKMLLALALAATVSGCVISVGDESGSNYGGMGDIEEREYNNRKHISGLELNTHYEDIVREMGVADFNEMYERDNGQYRVLYYRTQRLVKDGLTTKNECTPLIFKNDRLVGWGDKAFSMM